MGWTALDGIKCAKVAVLHDRKEEASMEETNTIGLDLAKNAIQVHRASASGAVTFRRKLTRAELLPFPAEQPRCVVAMEACASSHHWGARSASWAMKSA
jgi:transposase